ncbi:hypothetical protein [Caldicellulosiruptor acetigenus]|nr:hypothetical protein [Caldicellulosiruptor acetigenus]
MAFAVAAGCENRQKGREKVYKRLHKDMAGFLEKVNKKASPKAKTQPDQELEIQENTHICRDFKTLLFYGANYKKSWYNPITKKMFIKTEKGEKSHARKSVIYF